MVYARGKGKIFGTRCTQSFKSNSRIYSTNSSPSKYFIYTFHLFISLVPYDYFSISYPVPWTETSLIQDLGWQAVENSEKKSADHDTSKARRSSMGKYFLFFIFVFMKVFTRELKNTRLHKLIK